MDSLEAYGKQQTVDWGKIVAFNPQVLSAVYSLQSTVYKNIGEIICRLKLKN
jgi:hypothetical protein